MSWPTGICEKCKQPFDYRYSWGYEKPHGLEYINRKLLCETCRKKNNKRK